MLSSENLWHDTQSGGRKLLIPLQIALQSYDPAAIEMAKLLVSGRPKLLYRWLHIGRSLLALGQLDLGRKALALFVEQTAYLPSSRLAWAGALNDARLFAEAWAVLENVDQNVVPVGDFALLKGSIAMSLGKMDVAERELRRATEIMPASGKAWLRLSMIEEINPLELSGSLSAAAPAINAASLRDQTRYHYARGAVLDRLEQWEVAFSAFCQAACLHNQPPRYDFDADFGNARNALDGGTHEILCGIRDTMMHRANPPIIVTGLPRSGTTLVEQILTSHSSIGAGDELNYFRQIATAIGGTSAIQLKKWITDGGNANTLAAAYLDLVEQRFGPGRRIVDKTVEASRYLGFATSLFPNAPIVWLRRETLDNAWSNFRTYFSAQIPWACDFRAMAKHFQVEDDLLSRWSSVLGSRLLVVCYEDLARHPETEIPRILGHCGLDMETAVMNPELNPRAVTTMSVTQVRRPITGVRIGVSRPYGKFLQPFIDAYIR